MMSSYSIQDGIPVAVHISEEGSGRPDWVNLSNPTEEECRKVGEQFRIPMDHLRAALDPNERPRIESGDGTLLMIARVPVRTGDSDDTSVPFRTRPIACILTPEVLVTVCLDEHFAKNLLREKIRHMGQRTGPSLMLKLLFRISTTFIDHLRELDQRVSDIEQTLQKSMHNRELLRMLHIEKTLIYFLTALKSNASVMEKLSANPMLVESAAERDLLEDVLIENKQATDMAAIYTEIMGVIGDGFGAIVSNNLNKVMKILASLTIIFMIPSVIGAIYGMNVALPFQEHRFAFVVLCLFCLLLSLTVYKVLRKLDWL